MYLTLNFSLDFSYVCFIIIVIIIIAEEEFNEKGTSNVLSLERCKFWPECKNGENCAYFHPTVPCRQETMLSWFLLLLVPVHILLMVASS